MSSHASQASEIPLPEKGANFPFGEKDLNRVVTGNVSLE